MPANLSKVLLQILGQETGKVIEPAHSHLEILSCDNLR